MRTKFKFTRVSDEELLNCIELSHVTEKKTVAQVAVACDRSSSNITKCADMQIVASECEAIFSDSGLPSVIISECTGCDIHLDIPLGALYIHELVNCKIRFDGVQSSVNVVKSSQCSFSGYCSQMRITECNDVAVFVQTNSSTALAQCGNIRIGKPPLPTLHVLEKIKLSDSEYMFSDKWKRVNDFDCLGGQSTNWIFHTE